MEYPSWSEESINFVRSPSLSTRIEWQKILAGRTGQYNVNWMSFGFSFSSIPRMIFALSVTLIGVFFSSDLCTIRCCTGLCTDCWAFGLLIGSLLGGGVGAEGRTGVFFGCSLLKKKSNKPIIKHPFFSLNSYVYSIVLLIIAALLLPLRLSLGVFPTVTIYRGSP